MFKWSVQEGRSGGRQILHVRVSKGFASRPFYLGLGISKIVIFTWLEYGFSFCLNRPKFAQSRMSFRGRGTISACR